MNAPVALFCYNRADLLSSTLNALQENPESIKTELYIFSDGSKNEHDHPYVEQSREILKNIKGFKKTHIILRNKNVGLASNIISGVYHVLQNHDRVIVLEDDIKVSKHFLAFMNNALERYKYEPRIWHISAWNYPVKASNLSDMFLWRVMNCWGWATWADRWKHFTKKPDILIQNFNAEHIYYFNLDGCNDYWGQIKANHQGQLNTWAIFWYATIYLHDGLCLNPTQTLVDNLGFGSGTNCITEKPHVDELNTRLPINWPQQITESKQHVDIIKNYLLSNNSALPLNLSNYPLTDAERSKLISLLAQQNYSLKNSLQQIWYLMDLVWDQHGLNNQKLDHTKLQKYYSHPVWLLNGLYTESDQASILHRKLLAEWIKSRNDIRTLADIGGGIGLLARIATSHNPGLKAEVLEPFPSKYALRTIADNPQVDFIAELNKPYDCMTLMDVLEHVEDPVSMIYSLLPYIKKQGYLITGNCFQPVIKCHLPCTFHLNYSFTEIMDALGFDFIERIADTHIEIFRKSRASEFATARERERLSRAVYKNILNDTGLLTNGNNSLHLNLMLSRLYKRLDEVIKPDQHYIVYGAGTGARLLVETMNKNISFLVDKNPNTWNETRFGKKIYSPKRLQNSTEKILISVFGREKDVADYLLNTLQIPPDRIVRIQP